MPVFLLRRTFVSRFSRFIEAGTQNIAGIIGLGEAVQYLEQLGMDRIHQYEVELKEYAVKRMKEIPQITFIMNIVKVVLFLLIIRNFCSRLSHLFESFSHFDSFW